MHQMCEVLLLFILLKKVTLEPESIVLVLKNLLLFSSQNLQLPCTAETCVCIFLQSQLIWQCLTLEDEYFEQSQNFHLCFLNEFPHCLRTVTKFNEIDMIVLNTIKVSLSGFNFICCIKCIGFISGHIRGDT